MARARHAEATVSTVSITLMGGSAVSGDALRFEGARPPWEPLAARRRRIRRTGRPAWTKNLHHALQDEEWDEHEALGTAWGEQVEWGWAVPWLWAQLRDPRTTLRAPATPVAGTQAMEAGAYWVPALHLMRYALGWSRLDQGLAAWLMAGRPRTSPSLRLLDDVWARDGQLEWLVAWLGRASLGQVGSAEGLDGLVVPRLSATSVDWRTLEGWLDAVERAAATTGISNPISGGGNPLHLSGHCYGPLADLRPGVVRYCDGSLPMVVVDGGVGWYSALAQAPVPSGPGEMVDVVSLSLGWIGTFTRSPETGRWYRADTDPFWHMAGN